MSFLTKLLGRRSGSEGGDASDPADKTGQKDGRWQCILVPAFELPFSERSLAVASRLAKQSGGQVILAYLIEVPRAFALNTEQPEEETIAERVLTEGAATVNSFHVPMRSTVCRTRNVRDGIRKLIKEETADLLILGRRHDNVRGLSRDLAKDLFDEAPCEVIVDYIAAAAKE